MQGTVPGAVWADAAAHAAVQSDSFSGCCASRVRLGSRVLMLWAATATEPGGWFKGVVAAHDPLSAAPHKVSYGCQLDAHGAFTESFEWVHFDTLPASDFVCLDDGGADAGATGLDASGPPAAAAEESAFASAVLVQAPPPSPGGCVLPAHSQPADDVPEPAAAADACAVAAADDFAFARAMERVQQLPHFHRACRAARVTGDATILMHFLEKLRRLDCVSHAALATQPVAFLRVVNDDAAAARDPADGSTAEVRALWAVLDRMIARGAAV
jgi:hypothetical protein